jgi:autotransporter-associated beta strand protein
VGPTNLDTPQEWISSGRIAPASAGALALTADQGSATVDLRNTQYTTLHVGAVPENLQFTGTVYPAGNNVYNLGGGPGTFTANTALQNDGPTARSVNVAGNVVLAHANSYTDGTVIDRGLLTFGSTAGTVPQTGTVTIRQEGVLVADGPTGFGTACAWIQSGKVAGASDGTLALADNADDEDIDLSGHDDLCLASVIDATYTGHITPASNGYLLGGTMATLTVGSALTGAGAVLTVRGNVVLTGANTFSGGVRLERGVLSVSTIADTGSSNLSTGPVTLDGGTLRYTPTSGYYTTRQFIGGPNGGTIDLPNPATHLAIMGGFTGSSLFTLRKLGRGAISFFGSTDNRNLILDAQDGWVNLAKAEAAGVYAVAGISDIAPDAIVRFWAGSSHQIAPGSGSGPVGLVHMSGGELWSILANQSWDRLTGTGIVDGAGARVTLGVAGGSSTFDGVIRDGSDYLGLTKIGNGTLTLNGANTYTDATTINAGTLVVNGSLGNTEVTVNGGTLAGTGTIGGEVTVASGAYLSPGVNGAGTLTTGKITFASGASYVVDLSDSGHDQLNVTGTVDPGNAALTLSGTLTDHGRDVVVVVQNDGVDWITGTFLDLSEGAEVNVGPATFLLTYRYNAEAEEAGTGNDVALVSRPAAPSGLTATAISASEIVLSWTDDSGTATGFTIERMTATQTWTLLGIVGAGVTSYTDQGLMEGEHFYYRVRATLSPYQSGRSAMAYALTLPEPPTDVAVTFVSGAQADVTWYDYSWIEAGYSVEQLIDGDWEQLQTVAPTPDSGPLIATVTGAFSPSTEHSFRVRAFEYDDYGDPLYSQPSSETLTTPAWAAAPTDLAATAISDTQIDLAWTDNATDETGYKIERSADGSIWTLIDTAGANSTTYSDDWLIEGEATLWYYRIRAAKSGVGDSAYSDAASATTLPAGPSSLAAEILDGSLVELTWTDNSAIETGCSIEQLMSDGVTWQEIQTADADVESLPLIGVFEPLTEYTFRVTAFQELGDSYPYYVYSQPSNEATVNGLAWPMAPTGLTATAASTTQIDLSWTDDDTSQTGYRIERGGDGTTWAFLATINDPDIKQYSNAGLAEGALWHYRVQATNSVGGSGYSTAVGATLLATPTGLQVTAISGSAVSLAWADNSAHETGYSILQLVGSDWEEIGWTDADASTATVEGTFEASTEYSFRVQASSDWSSSQPSNTATAAPVAWPDPPADLTATATSGTEIDLSWTASSGATSYSVEMQEGDPGDWSAIGTVTAPQTTFAATGLSPDGTEYSFRVAAVNTAGSSAFAFVFNVATQNASPTVGTPAAGANPVTGTSTTLSVVGDDDGSEPALTYTWSVVSAPTGGDPWFSINESNDAKNTTVTFGAAGTHTFQVTATDLLGATATSSTLNVIVNQTLSGIVVTPADAAVLYGQSRQFSATGLDQFGDAKTLTGVSWSLGAGGVGNINSSGLYTAPAVGAGATFTVTASCAGMSGTANVALTPGRLQYVDVPLYADATPLSIKSVDLSSYHAVVAIEVTTPDSAGLHYDDFSFDTPSGHASINFDELAYGTVVTNQYQTQGAVFNGGSVSDDLPWQQTWHVYMPPGGWSGLFRVDFARPVENLQFTTGWVDTNAGYQFATVRVYTAASTLLELTVADHGSPTNRATAVDAAIRDLYVAEDENRAAHVGVDVLFAPSDAGSDVHLRITRTDGLIVADDYWDEFNSPDLSLPVSEQARDFAVMAWLDENHNGQVDAGEDKRQVGVHVPALDVGTMDVVNGANTRAGWLAKNQKDTDGAWVPLNTGNNAYQFDGITKKEDRYETNVAFYDDALLPIRITPAGNTTSYSLDFNQEILHIFKNNDHTGAMDPGEALTVTKPEIYYVEGFGGGAGTATTIKLNALANGQVARAGIDKIKINIFTWKGPQNVPNYAT